jgi:hypothetical protein
MNKWKKFLTTPHYASVTVFSKKHYLAKNSERFWFYWPDEHSTGGTGVNLFRLHIVYMWGYDEIRR